MDGRSLREEAAKGLFVMLARVSRVDSPMAMEVVMAATQARDAFSRELQKKVVFAARLIMRDTSTSQ